MRGREMETRNTVDDELVKAIENYKAGDSGAFDYIYEYSRDKLNKYALYLTGNREDAEDLLQDAYLKILEKCGTISENAAFMSWARTIMYNLFITGCRRNAKEFVCEDDALNAFIDCEHVSEDPEDMAERAEVNREVDAAVETLTSLQQDVIREFYYNDRPVSWIASAVKTPENTVKTRLFYARRALKTSLGKLA